MSKPGAIILCIVGWVGVGIVSNFSKIVPHASPREVQPFVVPVLVLAVLLTIVMIRKLSAAPAAPIPKGPVVDPSQGNPYATPPQPGTSVPPKPR